MGFSSWGKSADAKDSVSRTIPSRKFHSRIRYSSIRNKVINLSADSLITLFVGCLFNPLNLNIQKQRYE